MARGHRMTTPSLLLASDLDGTLIPTGEQRLRTAAVSEFALRFEGKEDIALTYVTGRHLDPVSVNNFETPAFRI